MISSNLRTVNRRIMNDLIDYFSASQWQAESKQKTCHLTLIHPSEAQLHFILRQNRLQACSCYELDGYRLTSVMTSQERKALTTMVTCSLSRSSAAITRDIDRRLVIPYLRNFSEYKERYYRYIQKEKLVLSLTKELAKIVKTTPYSTDPYAFSQLVNSSDRQLYLSCNTSYSQGGAAELKLTGLSFAQTRQILELLSRE